MFSWPNLFKRTRNRPDFSSIHPLVTPEVLERRWKDCGAEWYDAHAHVRGSGRSTKQVHEAIALAYDNPNRWVPVCDHQGSVKATETLIDNIRHVVQALGYKHFYFCKRRMTIRFGGDPRG